MTKKMKTRRFLNIDAIKSIMTSKILHVFVVLIALSIFSAYILQRTDFFIVKDFQIYGNSRLNNKEVIRLLGITDRNIVSMNMPDLSERLLQSPWVREVSIRKEFPDKLLVRLNESIPVGLLDNAGIFYLVDDRGIRLEPTSQKGQTAQTLPTIRLSSNDRRVLSEAVRLSELIIQKGIMKWAAVEITGSCVEELAINIEGTKILIGYGEYEEKLKRYMLLKDEIKRRNYPIDYIDVRFLKRLIVKTQDEKA